MTGAPPAQNARFRRAVTLLLLTLVAPGSAQLVAGNRAVGRVAIRTAIGVAAIAGLVGLIALISLKTVVGLLANETLLAVVRFALVVVAVGWLGLFVDAWRLGRPLRLRPRQRLVAAGMTGILSCITVSALILSSQYVAAAHDSLSGIFGSGEKSDPLAGRYNVLLLGADSGEGRVGLRPDSLTLASIDAETGESSLFSFPRNLEKVPFPKGSVMHKQFPNGFDCGQECLLNAVYTWGAEHEDLFPDGTDPGMQATIEAIEGISGLKVNYHVLVDLHGFEALIDALGGITIDVKQRLPIGGVEGEDREWIEPGKQKLDGMHALWYARSRETTSDYDRMARQRCVMSAMLRQLEPANVLAKFQGIARAGNELVTTDIPASELDTFVDLGVKAKRQDISSTQFVPPLIETYDPDYKLIRKKVRATISQQAEPDTSAQQQGSAGSPRSKGPDDAGGADGADGADGAGGAEASSNDASASSSDDSAASEPDDSGTPPPSGDLTSVCAAT